MWSLQSRDSLLSLSYMTTATLKKSTNVTRAAATGRVRSRSERRNRPAADYEVLSGARRIEELRRMGFEPLARLAEMADKYFGR